MANAPGIGERLQQVIDLNQAFLDAVTDGDWGAATALEGHRRNLLASLLAGPIEVADRQRVLNTLRELLQSDRLLVEQLEAAREHCSGQMAQLQLGRVATHSYNDTSMIMQGPRLMQ